MSEKKNLLDVVRVKDPKTGAEYNATRAEANRAKLQILDKPVRDERTGLPTAAVAPKPRTDLAGRPVPAGSPSVSGGSTVAEIDAYAADHDIDLAGATNKTDKLAAITAAEKQEG